MDAVEFLNSALDSWLMFLVWAVPTAMAIRAYRRRKSGVFQLFVLAFVPLLLYYVWGVTGWWHRHEVALAFNRSAQIVSAAIFTAIIVGLDRDG